jgi:hypothetical protein
MYIYYITHTHTHIPTPHEGEGGGILELDACNCAFIEAGTAARLCACNTYK